MHPFEWPEYHWEPQTPPTLAVTDGPTRTVTDQPATEDELPDPVGFAPQPRKPAIAKPRKGGKAR